MKRTSFEVLIIGGARLGIEQRSERGDESVGVVKVFLLDGDANLVLASVWDEEMEEKTFSLEPFICYFI